MGRSKLILECAKNHNGDIKLAKQMILEASKVKADYVKFQAYDLNDLRPEHNNYKRYVKCHLSMSELKELKEYADTLNIGFFCSVFSYDSIEPLSKFTDIVKIPSTYFYHREFINRCSKHFNKVFVSNGMEPLTIIAHDPAVELFHCVSQYPTLPENAALNLLNIPAVSGYSDHTVGVSAMVIAYLKGVKYIEKHFSIDPDRKSWEASPHQIELFNNTTNRLAPYLNSNKPNKEIKRAKEFFLKEFNTLKDII